MTFHDETRDPPPTGAIDRFVRRFHAASWFLALVVLYLLVLGALTLALIPALAVARWKIAPAWNHGATVGLVASAFWLVVALFTAAASLLLVVPLLNAMLPTRLRPFKGGYFTVAAVPWYLHNGLLYLVRFTVLPYITLTPLGIWFLRAMGMRIGRRVRISTEFFSDAAMIELGDDTAVGGSAQLFAHYGGGGNLVIAPLCIGRRVTIGEKATIMGDVIIGDDAIVLAHSVLLPGARVPPGARWGGVPARPIPDAEWKDYRERARGGMP